MEKILRQQKQRNKQMNKEIAKFWYSPEMINIKYIFVYVKENVVSKTRACLELCFRAFE